MPDRIERLRATVRELSSELGQASEVDPETRALLRQIARDIESALGERESPEDLSEDLSSRLTSAARHFESKHPTIAGILERLVDALGQLGI